MIQFDVFKYNEAVAFVAERLLSGMSPSAIAEAIVDDALKRGSLDNVTCIIVFLDKEAN